MAQTEVSRADVGLRSERGPVLLSIMLSVGLVAIDSTILATAVPSIVRDLGGFAQFPWLFSIYLLTAAVSTPVFAKFSDIHGRKPVMLVGIALFVLGSILCGFAWNMTTLIIFRGLQGLGAGAIQPTSMTIIGDLYNLAERAKVQGYVASVWAMSAVVGPTLGGVFSDFLTWRWIFFVNVPLGALAAWMLARHFTEDVKRAPHKIDVAGAVLLTLASTLMIFGLLEGGVLWSWLSPWSIGVLGLAVLLLAAFVGVERKAAEPIVPGWVFRRRLLVGANLTNLAVGVMLIGLTSYVPLFVQDVLGTSALIAGFALAALTVGWPISASLSGRIYLRIGFRNTSLIGSAIAGSGGVLMVLLNGDSSIWFVALTCFVIGLGMGLVASPTLVAAQSSVDWSSRGVVTGTSMFARSMGSAVGIAVFGAIANAAIGTQVGGHGATSNGVPPEVLEPALHQVFVAAAVVAVVMLIAVAIMPRRAAGAQA